MKYIIYKDDFDTGEYINIKEFDTEKEAQAFLDKLNETASLEDSYFICKEE
jgi:hypothetical protein